MKLTLPVEIESQPTDSTCGATCLHAIYKYWEDPFPIASIIAEIPELETGGTMAVQLACHALSRGYTATIYTYNLQVFDPSWFEVPQVDMADRLRRQCELKRHSTERLAIATGAYLRFLELGGQVAMRPLERQLIKHHLTSRIPILVGLSATFLYQESRERPVTSDEAASVELGLTSVPDDLAGYPVGHFVVLRGYDEEADAVMIADPLHPNPKGRPP